MKETKTKYFIIDSEVTTKIAMELTIFFAECKLQKANALLIINAAGGSMDAVAQIDDAYKVFGVHLITIGAGRLSNCTSALFCLGDERILLPNTSLSLHIDFQKYFCEKTKITEEIFAQNKLKIAWLVDEKDYEEYGITTQNHEGWFDIVVEAMKDDNNLGAEYFCFSGEFNNKNAIEVLKYFVACKLNKAEKATILINSPGGAVQQLSFILEVYKASQLPLTVLGTGQVGSCASCLFCMGDERILLPNTKFLIHHPSCDKNGKVLYDELIDESKGMIRCDNYIFEILSKKTKLTKYIYTKKCRKSEDWILSDEEIKKYDITTKDFSEWMNVLTEVMMKKDDKEDV